MSKRISYLPYVAVPLLATLVVTAPSRLEASSPTMKLGTATLVLQSFTTSPAQPGQVIPTWLLRRSQGIAIIPNVVQAGFFLGGRRGSGVLMVRNAEGNWSHPAFITLTGGSFGLQFGAQSTDLVLVFMNKLAVYKGLGESFTLGGNVSAAAGPVGGEVVSPADPSPQVYTYSRSQGLFAGVSLEGAKIAFDREVSDRYYNRSNLTPFQIFNNKPPLPTPTELSELQQALVQATRTR
uniref:Ysc84 actin-binding domain-containing protein n=1 Tax=Cyanothece sp. (strain PCC 7425 / ATCC 29141) TaxID=395961 RepID=B8HXG0_CYAP4